MNLNFHTPCINGETKIPIKRDMKLLDMEVERSYSSQLFENFRTNFNAILEKSYSENSFGWHRELKWLKRKFYPPRK